MGALDSSGELQFLDIYRNKENSTTATPGSTVQVSLKSYSEFFASGSTVGDVDGNGTANQTADRDALNSAQYKLSEFYSADYPNSLFSTVIAQDGSGNNVMANGYIDGETVKVSWRADDGTSDTYTAGVKDASTNAILASATLTNTATDTNLAVTFTAPSMNAEDDAYYPFVSTGTFTNAVGANNINHYDAIATVTIASPSSTAVTAHTTAQTVTHSATIGDQSSLSSYAWTFARDSTVSTDGTSNPSPTTATTATQAVSYTGPGRYKVNLTVKGGKAQDDTVSSAVANRNSVSATQVTFDVAYTDAVTAASVNDTNEGNITIGPFTHQGLAGGAKVGIVNSTATSTFLASDSTDTATSNFEVADVTKTVSVTTTNTTIVAQSRIEDKAASTTNANSSNFNIYPDVTTELAATDISVTVNPVIVGANTVLSVGNISDNITGYAWTLQSGTGTMTSTNASGGGTGTSTRTIINEQTAATNTVSFSAAGANKTIRLTLNARLSQTDTADKTINVELADAVTVGSISNINSGASVTVAGNQSGLEHGVYFGLVAATDTDGFLESGTFTTATDSTDSRYATDAYTATVTPTNGLTTLTLQGRVEDRNSGGNPAGNISANTTSFTVYPTIDNTRNTINPNRTTIYSTTNNTDTSTYPTTVTFQTPGNTTDNVTARQYVQSETGPSGHSFTTATAATTNWGGGSATGDKVITLNITGTGATATQTSTTNSTIAVNFMPKFTNATITGGTIIENVTNVIVSVLNWQGSAVTALAAKVVATSTSTTAINSNGLVAISGTTNFTNNLTDATANNVQGSSEWFPKGGATGIFNLGTINADGTKVVKITSTSSPSISLDQNISVSGFTSVLLRKRSSGGWSNAEDAMENEGGSFSEVTKYHLGTFGNSITLYDTNSQSTAFNGSNYYYNVSDTHVIQVNTSGTTSNYFAEANVPPKAPTSLGFTSVTTTAMTLGWTDNSGIEDGFKIYRNTGGAADSGDTLVSTTSANATSFTATSLSASTTYYWAVYAFNGTSLSTVLQGSQATPAPTPTISISPTSAIDTNYSELSVGTNPHDTVYTITSDNRGGNNIRFAHVASTMTNNGNFKFKHTTDGTAPSTSATGATNLASSGNITTAIADADTIKIRFFMFMDELSPADYSFDTKFQVDNESQDTSEITVTFRIASAKCVDSTMLLNMVDGMKHIDSVSSGDMIMSYNMDTKTQEAVKIKNIIQVVHDTVHRIKFSDGSEMLMTDDHPMISIDDRLVAINSNLTMTKYKVKSDKLVVGDEIRNTNGVSTVTAIEKVDGDRDTYTIVTENDNFYANNILVHQGIEDLKMIEKLTKKKD